MNKIIFLLLIFCACTTFAIAGVSKTNKSLNLIENKTKIKLINDYFKLALWQVTDSCPSGYSGTTTYWIVYDDVTGAVYGAGTTGGCTPVNEA